MSNPLKALVVTGLCLGTLTTALGVLANWWPALDIINNGLPFLATGCLALLGLADAVVLEEVRPHHDDLLAKLGALYPHRVGEQHGLVIMSKHKILADGRIDREGQPPRMSLIIRWARLDVNGTPVELAGVHLARPFYPELQQADIIGLTNFVKTRSGSLILAGDFNMAPWTWKLKRFTQATGLGRFNTFHPT